MGLVDIIKRTAMAGLAAVGLYTATPADDAYAGNQVNPLLVKQLASLRNPVRSRCVDASSRVDGTETLMETFYLDVGLVARFSYGGIPFEYGMDTDRERPLNKTITQVKLGVWIYGDPNRDLIMPSWLEESSNGLSEICRFD